MRRSETIGKLAVSLVKFNSEISKISKDAKNPFFKSNYVTLDKGNRKVTSIENLKVKNPTLIKIDNDKVVSYNEGKNEIIKALGK